MAAYRIDHRALRIGDAFHFEKYSYSSPGLGYVFARLDDARDPLFRFGGRKDGEANSDRFQRRPEDFVRWAVGQPIEKLTIIGRLRRHAALLRYLQNGIARGMADLAIGPGDFDQRRQDERRPRVERDAELLDALEKLRFVCVKFLCQRVSNLAELGLLAQLRDQHGVMLTEIGLFLAALTFAEYVLRHTTSNRRAPVATIRLHAVSVQVAAQVATR